MNVRRWLIPSRHVWWRLPLLLLTTLAGLSWYMMAMPGASWSGKLPAPTSADEQRAARLRQHITIIAQTERHTGNPQALAAAAQYLEQTLTTWGYRVISQPYDSGAGWVRNLEVEIPGSTSQDIVVIGAHYDTVPDSPGANDNASGVALLLELAQQMVRYRPQRTLRLVWFTNEEPPYFGTAQMGSYVYAARSRQRGENIVAMLSLESLGHYRDEPGSQRYPAAFQPFYPDIGNYAGFVGMIEDRPLVHRVIKRFRQTTPFPSEGVAGLGLIPGIAWSDHWAFWKHGYPALMITDTAPFRYRYYHTAKDTPDRVDVVRMAKLYPGVAEVVRDLLDGD